MPIDPKTELEKPLGSFDVTISAWGAAQPDAPALADSTTTLNWGELDQLTSRIAARLQADGLGNGQAVAVLGTTNISFTLAYLAAIRAGGCAAPLTISATPQQLIAMLRDSGARHVFVESAKLAELPREDLAAMSIIFLDGPQDGIPGIMDWIADAGTNHSPVIPSATDPFNIIYSSGTTGTPKGIVHSHEMRWRQMAGGFGSIFSTATRTLVATPLYSNTTLAAVLPTLCNGGFVRVMEKFDSARYLQNAAADRTTHTMLVPVQYQRLMAFEHFDEYDLTSYAVKFCTSAPFAAELKADIVKRWPGAMVEIYGLTEGGVVCMLHAHAFPDKLHTVGQPITGHELIVIDEDGNRLPAGSKGEMVGRSPTMMLGYKGQPEKTREMHWLDETGNIWFRTGDIGIIDADGFVEIVGRAKDLIISGGFNIYPKDLEELLEANPAVAEAAVVGVPSIQWGETPVGFVTAKHGIMLDTDAVLADVNGQLGKTQRLSALYPIDEMPRSHIGKLLKTELRARISALERN